MIDANYRTLADQQHRAMAGLSMGRHADPGVITWPIQICFFIHWQSSAAAASVWMMSIIHPVFKEKVKLVFVSFGGRD